MIWKLKGSELLLSSYKIMARYTGTYEPHPPKGITCVYCKHRYNLSRGKRSISSVHMEDNYQ